MIKPTFAEETSDQHSSPLITHFTTFLSVSLTRKSSGLTNPSLRIVQSWVGPAKTMSNLRTRSAINLLSSIRAMFLPMQARGPRPNYDGQEHGLALLIIPECSFIMQRKWEQE